MLWVDAIQKPQSDDILVELDGVLFQYDTQLHAEDVTASLRARVCAGENDATIPRPFLKRATPMQHPRYVNLRS